MLDGDQDTYEDGTMWKLAPRERWNGLKFPEEIYDRTRFTIKKDKLYRYQCSGAYSNDSDAAVNVLRAI